MEGRAKNVSALIFLFGIFVMLGIMLGGWLYSMYTTNIGFTKRATASAIQCGEYSFTVENLAFDPVAKTLQLSLTNTFGNPLDDIVVESNSKKQLVNLTHLTQGATETITVPLEAEQEILVYPQGCRENNAKRFVVS